MGLPLMDMLQYERFGNWRRRKLYLLYKSTLYSTLVFLAIAVHMALAFLEAPSRCPTLPPEGSAGMETVVGRGGRCKSPSTPWCWNSWKPPLVPIGFTVGDGL